MLTSVEVTLSPEQLAEQYAQMDNNQMVAFWNHLYTHVQATYTQAWFGFAIQTEMVRDEMNPMLTTGGRIMQKIVGGDY